MSNTPIADIPTPDPWILSHNGVFYLTFTLGNRIEIWSSSNLESFHTSNPTLRKTTIYQPPPNAPWSVDIWAPELHRIDDRWWVYFTAAQPGRGHGSHRTLVMKNESGGDPMVGGNWVFRGEMKGMVDHWSIDATVFEFPSSSSSSDRAKHGEGKGERGLYCCYSGWPVGDTSDTQQDLFLVRLSDPETAITDTMVCISRAELPWERPENGRRGINEGPAFVSIPPSPPSHGRGFMGIIYSANASWTADYQLGVLELVDPSNLLSPASWRKRSTPLLVADQRKQTPPFGPGHASFVASPYGDGKVFCVYHATDTVHDGWDNRRGRVLCLDVRQLGSDGGVGCCAFIGGGGGGGSHGGPWEGRGGGGIQGQIPPPQTQPPYPGPSSAAAAGFPGAIGGGGPPGTHGQGYEKRGSIGRITSKIGDILMKKFG